MLITDQKVEQKKELTFYLLQVERESEYGMNDVRKVHIRLITPEIYLVLSHYKNIVQFMIGYRSIDNCLSMKYSLA